MGPMPDFVFPGDLTVIALWGTVQRDVIIVLCGVVQRDVIIALWVTV